jgi:hypothetical protein
LGLLVRERWPFTSPWGAAINDLDDILAHEPCPDQIVPWAMRVSQNFGVGMGSMSDTYISDDFDSVRQLVQESLWSVVEAAQSEPKNPLRLRRHLTELETVLLDAKMADDAAEVRQLLSCFTLDIPAVKQLVQRLLSRGNPGQAILAALHVVKSEIDAEKAEG